MSYLVMSVAEILQNVKIYGGATQRAVSTVTCTFDLMIERSEKEKKMLFLVKRTLKQSSSLLVIGHERE